MINKIPSNLTNSNVASTRNPETNSTGSNPLLQKVTNYVGKKLKNLSLPSTSIENPNIQELQEIKTPSEKKSSNPSEKTTKTSKEEIDPEKEETSLKIKKKAKTSTLIKDVMEKSKKGISLTKNERKMCEKHFKSLLENPLKEILKNVCEMHSVSPKQQKQLVDIQNIFYNRSASYQKSNDGKEIQLLINQIYLQVQLMDA